MEPSESDRLMQAWRTAEDDLAAEEARYRPGGSRDPGRPGLSDVGRTRLHALRARAKAAERAFAASLPESAGGQGRDSGAAPFGYVK